MISTHVQALQDILRGAKKPVCPPFFYDYVLSQLMVFLESKFL